VTLALLFALKGAGNRAFHRWLKRDHLPLFPKLPHRTRLFRLFNTHRQWIDRFMAEPTVLSVIDTYGIELIHPVREGHSAQQIGRKGKSNSRWIVGGKLCLLQNRLGLIVDWDCDTANVYDGSAFQHVVEGAAGETVVFPDVGFAKKGWHPDHLRLCQCCEWNDRMMVETTLSMVTLVQWSGLEPDETGMVHLSIAEFSL